MQSVMGITTLMISQIPEQTDAESFRWNMVEAVEFSNTSQSD